ncbi:FAD-dependent oxidoreductase [Coraliomargarita sp. SDUM461004]|uniref:FAD-dependent oxidoreductase n=1 Tax=Thalassobacterium sedimentorum TaxID=3041258 RepID=A0ABU1AJH6_9BACT|nr:FAD-dependent oxidoreductase [Coraliomargarita sp. SDUM461004]MDQ8194941.1 FAD-dependent oxidoreductase [Coraliomargarita sp. SDUM461004]
MNDCCLMIGDQVIIGLFYRNSKAVIPNYLVRIQVALMNSDIPKNANSQKARSYDVIVCGGGPSGIAAALASARRGAKTLLIERYGFCGGMATAALVNPFSGHAYRDQLAPDKKRASLIGGIFKEIACRLHERGGFGSVLMDAAFDEELLKRVYDAALIEAGVVVRYHTQLRGVQQDGDRIVSIKTISKGGETEYRAKTFIDCSGDGDLAASVGCSFSVGRSSDGLTQAMTVSFRMANVDKRDMYAAGSMRAARDLVEPYFQRALAAGELHYPYRNFIHFYDYPRPGVLHFNMTRITCVSGLSTEDLTLAEIEGRRQAYVLGEWLVENVPYFKNAFIDKVACQVGIRETRHIHGLYTMTTEDIVEAKKFKDGIARSRYFIDIHNPKGAKDLHQQDGARGRVLSSFGPPEDDFYEIPFRSLVSPSCSNLLVACRALSASHEASAAVRVMATMHAVGEAAGIASSEAVAQGVDVTSISGEWVRSQIPYMEEGPDYGYPWSEEFKIQSHSTIMPLEVVSGR